MLDISRWLLKRVVLPFFLVWLAIILVLFLFGLSAGAGIGVLLYATSGILVIILFFVLPFALYSFYQNRIQRTYPFLVLGNLSTGDACPLCKGIITAYEGSGRSFLLLPFSFPDFRHYEQKHEAVAQDAKKARLSLTGQLYVGIIAIATIIAASSPSKFRMANGDLLIVLVLFLIPFLSIISLALIVLYLMFRRKLRGPS